MKKSELKSLIQEVMDEMYFGGNAADKRYKAMADSLKGKTITDVEVKQDDGIRLTLDSGEKVDFRALTGITSAFPPKK